MHQFRLWELDIFFKALRMTCLCCGWIMKYLSIWNNFNLQRLSSELRKKPSYFPLYWLVYRDPYIGLLKSPYFNWVVQSPIHNPNNQGFFHCSSVFPPFPHNDPRTNCFMSDRIFGHSCRGELEKNPVKFMNQSEFQKNNKLVGGFNPSEKYESNLVHLPQVGMNIKKH